MWKYLIVMESQVSKCGCHIIKKWGVLYLKRTKYSKYRKGSVVEAANWYTT